MSHRRNKVIGGDEETAAPFRTYYRITERFVGLGDVPAPAHQVENQHYYSNHKQQMNQPASDTAEHSQQPQDQQNDQDCPKHSNLQV
jgi:hypothetical protein